MPATSLKRMEERAREVASWEAEPEVLSLYLDADGRRRPRISDRERAFGALARQALANAETGGPEVLERVRVDLQDIARWLEDHRERGQVRGLAFFSCARAGRFAVFELAAGVRDQVTVAAAADLGQLLAVLDHLHPYLIALVDREQGRLLTRSGATVTTLADLFEDAPRRHDQGGRSAANLQRHTDELARRHLSGVATAVTERLREHPDESLILGGPDEDLAVLEGRLTPGTRSRVRGRVRVRVDAPQAEVARAVGAVVDRLEVQEETLTVDRVDAALASGEALAGLEASLTALGLGRVDLLLAAAGHRAPGARCAGCGRLAPSPAACPRCGAPTTPVEDVVAAAIAQALASGTEVRIVGDGDRDRMRRLDGMAVLLRY